MSLETLKIAYANLSDEQKESAKFARNVFISRVIYSVGRAAVVHVIGRRIAPKVFTSFGRTYAISFAARLALRNPQLSDEAKVKLAAFQKTLREAQERQRNYGDHDDLIKG